MEQFKEKPNKVEIAANIWLGRKSLTGGEITTVDHLIKHTSNVTLEDVQRVAKDIFQNNRLSVALIADNINKKKITGIARLR